MKNTLLLIFIFGCIIGKSQNGFVYRIETDSYYINKDTLPNKKIKNLEKMKPRWDSAVTLQEVFDMEQRWELAGGAYDESPEIDSIWRADAVKDTIKVIMLVSDTSLTNGFQSQRCYWLKGYRIIEGGESDLYSYECTDKSGVHVPCPSNLFYLDDKKSPISKSLIVWLSKEIK